MFIPSHESVSFTGSVQALNVLKRSSDFVPSETDPFLSIKSAGFCRKMHGERFNAVVRCVKKRCVATQTTAAPETIRNRNGCKHFYSFQ